MSLFQGVRPDGTPDAVKLTSGSVLLVSVNGAVSVTGGATEAKQDDQVVIETAIAGHLAPASAGPVNFTASATTTPAALASNAGRRVLVVAEVANTAAVRVGGASVSTTVGIPIYPGGSREYEATDSALIHVCAVAGTQALNVEVIP